MVLAEQRVHLLKSESQRFVDYLSALPEESWGRQSACDRWLVGDVVAHLTGGVDNYFGNIVRGVAGDSSPPEGGAPSARPIPRPDWRLTPNGLSPCGSNWTRNCLRPSPVVAATWTNCWRDWATRTGRNRASIPQR